jgi:hypothetical protein
MNIVDLSPNFEALSFEKSTDIKGGQVVRTVTLYSGQRFQGRSFGTNNSIANLGAVNFDNITSSIQVQSGTWRFYTGRNFRGNFIELESETGLGSIRLDNQISSLRRIS